MAKIVIEEFDVCHKFLEEELQYLLPNTKTKICRNFSHCRL